MDKQYNHQASEQKSQQTWEQEKTYLAANNKGPLYSIDTPPPTVSGSLHIGHIFSYTQTDIVARYKRMSGFSVFYPFGFDDNGLPTERYVEQKLNVTSYSMSRSDFIKLCLQETKSVEEQFKHLWQRMGLSVDWNICYSTISEESRRLSQESFIELYKKGFIYRTYEPALYCTTCRTSVAQAELDDAQKPSFFNDIVFQDYKGNDLIIGTTRPELLPACVALLYNPHDTRYQYLRGTQATVPLYNFQVPVLEDEHVDIQKGTGLVMCCTFGDKTDIAWYKKFKLPYKQIIGLDGKWMENTGILAGLRAPAAREKIIEALKEKNLLIKQQPIMHSVNVHERCKKEIEYLALSQWFLNILEHKQHFIALADKINWYPHFMKSRYLNWVENISWDWCLSRQRSFGIPFPVWHCKDCATIILADIKELPIDPQETPYKGTCPHCKGSTIVPDTDVMDTWNTSSLTPYLCYAYYARSIGKPVDPFTTDTHNFIPMSMRPQAHDIIRTWAFYTIVKSWMHQGTIPWKDIVISGHVLSDAKEKISKSKGNNKLAPETLLEQYPADVIRYWTASGSLGQDVAFSENQLKIGQRLVTKLWNAFRFMNDHKPSSNAQPANLNIHHQWILHQASDCFKHYKAYFDKHEFGLALGLLEKFFWNDLCDNYLELIKKDLWDHQNGKTPNSSIEDTRWTLSTVGFQVLQMYAPYLPHLTETIYQEVYRQQIGTASLHQTRFSVLQQHNYPESIHIMEAINTIVGHVRRLKTEKQLALNAPIASLTITGADKAVLGSIEQQAHLIMGVTHAAAVVTKTGHNGTELKQTDALWHATVAV